MFLIISEIYLFLFRTHVKLGNRHKLSVGTEYIVDVLKSQTDNIAKEDAYTLLYCLSISIIIRLQYSNLL